MFNPPGCSHAVASEAELDFLEVPEPFLAHSFAVAWANAPPIIFSVEINGLAIICGEESDEVAVFNWVVSQLLVELDGK